MMNGCLIANVVPDDNELVPYNDGLVPNNAGQVPNNDELVLTMINRCLMIKTNA